MIASSTYPLDTVPAHLIAKSCGARMVYEVHDLWPLTPLELGGMSPRHPFIMLMQWAEDFAYRKADRVVSMLPYAAEHMQRHGMEPHKLSMSQTASTCGMAAPPPVPPEHGDAFDRLKARNASSLGILARTEYPMP